MAPSSIFPTGPDGILLETSAILAQSDASRLNASPGRPLSPSETSSSRALPAYPYSVTPTHDLLVDVDRSICIDHNIEVKMTPDGCAEVTGTAEIFNKLKGYQLIFLVDVGDQPKPRTMAMEAVSNLMQLATPYLDCEIEIGFTGDRRGPDSRRYLHRPLNKPNEILYEIFQRFERNRAPRDLAADVQTIIKTYIEDLATYRENPKTFSPEKAPKLMNLIVITNCDSMNLERAEDLGSFLVRISKYLEQEGYPPEQLGIQFVPITIYYPHQILFDKFDHDIHGIYKARDIVDWTLYQTDTLNAASLIKILLGAIDRRIDRGLRSEPYTMMTKKERREAKKAKRKV